jgi:hypothetical protein
MSLDEKFIPVRTTVYEVVNTFYKKVAGSFGFPENPGMPCIEDMPFEQYARLKFVENLPKHKTYWPPVQRPETWFEMVFGPTPRVDIVPRYIYESKQEGFYNFYIENYKNIYFLPDWVSEFIQVRLNICLDISLLETIREVLFIGLMVYSQMVILRIAISWLIYINPFTFPWCYLSAAVDWTEDVLQGIIPSILGVNVTGSLFLGMIGAVADSLNHLVFTIPFLPSEGEATQLLINGKLKEVLVFHYLPISWYKYPIPNSLREFWYYNRPDILEYMQKAYKYLDIQFLPDSIVEEYMIKAGQANSTIITQAQTISDYIPTEVVSNETILHSSTFLNSLFVHFFL